MVVRVVYAVYKASEFRKDEEFQKLKLDVRPTRRHGRRASGHCGPD